MMIKSMKKMLLIMSFLSVFIFVDVSFNSTYAWDQQANIEKSVAVFYKQLESEGMMGVEAFVKASYKLHDKKNPGNLKSLESCASVDIAAHSFDNVIRDKYGPTEYFAQDEVINRIRNRLKKIKKSSDEQDSIMLFWQKTTMKSMHDYVVQRNKE